MATTFTGRYESLVEATAVTAQEFDLKDGEVDNDCQVVHRGATWQSFWLDPGREYRGYEIIQAAIAETVRDAGPLPELKNRGVRD